MQSLPPIPSAGPVNTKSKGAAAAAAAATASSASDVHFLAATLDTHTTTASAADGINRNQLRQEAERRVQHITHGVAEQQTYLDMLQHIREQFAHTSQLPLRPLVLPPQWPSTARPREPQTAKFSRGIALSRTLLKRGERAATATSSSAEQQVTAATGNGQGRASSWKADPDAADETASYVPTELPSTSTGFARAHRWETVDTGSRSFFQRRLLGGAEGAAASATGSVKGDSIGQWDTLDPLHEMDLSPLNELPTMEEKVSYLADLESASRQHVIAYEKWDQQVISEMMAVRFVTFVLKPCMDALRMEEAEEREKIGQHEDRISFYLLHESPLVVAIAEELKAMKARELQLDRILGVAASPPRRPEPSGSAEASSTYFAGSDLNRTHSSYASLRAPRLPSVAGGSSSNGGVPAPEARRILQQYVRQRHGRAIDAATSPMSPSAVPKTWSPTATKTYPGTGANDTIRRSSALVLPPLPSAHAPRRNAVGIADYVALLDECMHQRDHILRAEQQSRVDLNRECYEEQQVVLEWQRRRMHLERLMYWRHQREGAVKDEVAALTEVNVGAPLDPKVVLLLEMLEEAEEDAREAIAAAERQCSEDELWAMDKDLFHRHERLQMEQACRAVFAKDVVDAEAQSMRDLLVFEESSTRCCMEAHSMAALSRMLHHKMAQLRVLWRVSVSPAHCAALRVLQSAFRDSLRGRLGWRATNAVLGREINDARNAKKISAGRRTLQSFKDTLAAEEAQLRKEQVAQDVQEQRVLFAGEAADRVAVSSEQDLIREGLRRARVLHVAEVFHPVFQRLVAAEQSARVQLEVEEEVDDEAMRSAHTALTSVISHKARTRYDEAASRRSLVAEERSVWRELLGTAADTREELRMEAEAEEAICNADRASFVEAALQASRAYRDSAFAAYVRSMTEAELEWMGYSSSDSAERWSILAEEARAAVHLFSTMSLQACAVHAQTLLNARQVAFDRAHRQALIVAETEKRADLLLTEAIDWEALKPVLMETLSGPLRDLIVRRGAVNAISTWYRALRNGDVGRGVSRQRLREDLARYRDERGLREQQIAQRLHTQQVREQLDVLMREIQQEEVEAVQQRINILVHREEPRERESVESMQEIVYGIIVRNAEAQTAEVRRQLVNTEALLWQQESYERKLLIKASRRAFADLMERERLQLSEDFFAARIQRTWIAYAARKRHAQAMSDQRARLFALEQQARSTVELDEVEGFALTIQKPCTASTYFYVHNQRSLSHVYDQLCRAIIAVTSGQEWQERVALLWEMRYDVCDFCLCSEEERARRELAADFDLPFVLQDRLLQAETQQRRVLAEERTLFLLRVLAREEQAHRHAVMAAEAEARPQATPVSSKAEL